MKAAQKRKAITPVTAPKASRPYAPGYGLSTDKKGMLPWTWAEERLTNSHNYWITTVRPDGRPHVMVVWGVWLDGGFWFSTGKESRKWKNLHANPNCVISTENAAEAVIVEGVAQQIRDKDFWKRFCDLYEPKYDWKMEGYKEEPFFAVRPRRIFALREKDFQKAATRWMFE
jgi:general stress protein 26